MTREEALELLDAMEQAIHTETGVTPDGVSVEGGLERLRQFLSVPCACRGGKVLAWAAGTIWPVPKEYLRHPEKPVCELHAGNFLCEGISTYVSVRVIILEEVS